MSFRYLLRSDRRKLVKIEQDLYRGNLATLSRGGENFEVEGKEIILAEERNVILRSKHSDGTLVLTNKRILFVPATVSDMPTSDQMMKNWGGRSQLISQYFTDVKDLKDLPMWEGQGDFLSIQMSSITNIAAHKGLLRPTLKVAWREDHLSAREVEFLQKFIGKSKRVNLTDWAVAIERIRNEVHFLP